MTPAQNGSRRRALVLAFTAVCLIFLLGFASLAVDIGHGYAIKAKLQNTADAAALAGAGALFSDELILKTYDPKPDIIEDVQEYTLKNAEAYKLTDNTSGSLLTACGDDIVIGHITDPTDETEGIDTAHPTINAVEVTLRRDSHCNGPVSTFFAGLIGMSEMNISAAATAYYDDRFAGFFPPPTTPGPLTPFSISKTYYEEQLAAPQDNLSWNPTTQTVQTGSDGIGEIKIYTDKQKGKDKKEDEDTGLDDLPDGGAGNYGTLHVGLQGNGTSDLGAQIQDGITQQQVTDALGTGELRFIDEDGGALTYELPGNPGISAGLSSYIEGRVGDVIAFFIHDNVSSGGSNAQFHIVGIAFGRLVEVNLHGSPSKKRVVIQPAVYGGPGVITDPNAPSSGGLVAVLRLIR